MNYKRMFFIFSVLSFMVVLNMSIIYDYKKIDVNKEVPCYDNKNNIMENQVCTFSNEDKELELIGVMVILNTLFVFTFLIMYTFIRELELL